MICQIHLDVQDRNLIKRPARVPSASGIGNHLRCCMNLVLVSSVATCFGARFAEATDVVDLGSTLAPKFQVSFK